MKTTLQDDIARAKEILKDCKGPANDPYVGGVIREKEGGEAYLLLETFVAEIEQLRSVVSNLSRANMELERERARLSARMAIEHAEKAQSYNPPDPGRS